MALTELPTAPSRSDAPATFISRADALLAALAGFVTEFNADLPDILTAIDDAASAHAAANAALLAVANGAGLFANSIQSLSLATGSTAANLVETGKSFAVDDAVVYISRSTPSARIYGTLTAFTSGSGAATFNRTSFSGAGGPYDDWMVIPTAFEPFIPPENANPIECIAVVVTDQTYAFTSGTAKFTFRMPYAFALSEIPRASLKTAQSSGNIVTVDINEAGTTILSTKLTIDNTEKTSTTAATPAVLSDSALADDAEMTIDIDQITAGTATAIGLVVYLTGRRVG